MDGSGSSGKRIVFTKGRLAPKSQGEEVLQEQAEQVPQVVQEAPSSDARFEGEIFDQYYRPLSVAGGVEKLKEIAHSCVGAPPIPPRLSKREREERAAKHQELAEALAHQLYRLAQQSRETEIDLYLSACNVVLGDKSPQDARDILDRANEFFTEHYYTAIRDRGERPEISHQIIKRVGHETADRITRVVQGLDVEHVAMQLWDLYHGPHADKESRITDMLLEHTEAQVRAIRDEFMLIPYKNLARQAHAILTAQATEPKAAARKSIGKNEVYEQKKQAAYRARDDMRALRYLFLGRSVEEMSVIKRFFADVNGLEQAESDVGLDAQVRKAFSQADFDRLGTLLVGWSPHQEASEIHELLYPKTLRNELDDILSDPRDTVDRDHTQGIGPFLRRFKKRRILRDRASVYHRVLNAYEIVAERVAALTPDRFIATNQALFEVYGYELDPTMFPSLAVFDARRVAAIVAERIEVAGDFFEIVGPLHFLEPRKTLAVQQAYQVMRGHTLSEVIEQRLTTIGQDLSAQQQAAYLARYIQGQGRVSLRGDILARYRGEEPEPGVWQWEYRSKVEDEEAAIKLAGLMDHDGAAGEIDQPIRDCIAELSYEELNRIERAFYDLTEPHMPLLEALRNCLSAETFGVVGLALAGFSARSLVADIHARPAMSIVLNEMPPSQVKTVRALFEKTHFVSLEQYVADTWSQPDEEDALVEHLACVLMPEVFQVRALLQRVSRSTADQIDFLREQCTGPLTRIMAFERGYDAQFPRLRVHLKFAAARMALSPAVFAELMLCLEGVDPEINQRLLEFFDAVDINSLLTLLRHYRRDQGIIEETYDLLNPDGTLRRSIKEMKVDLDIINETLLHVEGYSAKEVALELRGLIEQLSGRELGDTVLSMLAAPTPQRPNERIPEDINWMDEMVYQVGLAYYREYREDLIDACRAKGLDEHQLEDLTARVFGMEVCASAKELFSIIKTAKEGGEAQEHAEQRICSYLESRGLRYRARFVRAYNSFWAWHPGYDSMLDDIAKFFRDLGVRKKMHALLLGVGGEARGLPRGSDSEVIQ
jgi:hypothetical protein